MSNWLDDVDLDPNEPRAGPSFIERARRAPDDDDYPIADAFGKPDPILLGADAAEEEDMPFQQLIRHWRNERQAPDILPGQEMLLGRILDHVRKQVSCRTKTTRWFARGEEATCRVCWTRRAAVQVGRVCGGLTRPKRVPGACW